MCTSNGVGDLDDVVLLTIVYVFTVHECCLTELVALETSYRFPVVHAHKVCFWKFFS